MTKELTNFLKKENMMLKQQNKQLKTLLQLNRQALKVSSQLKKGQANFLPLVHLLFQENSKLYQKVDQLSTDLETGMCQALISEQIAFASTEQQKYLTSQLKDRLTKMRKQLEQRQKKIYELTTESKRVASSQTQQHQIKAIQITDLTTITKKLKDEIIDLRNQNQQKRQQAMKYKDQKQQLLKLNLILTKQISQYKFMTSQQSTSSNDLGSGDMSKFLSYQKKIIQDEDDPESESEQELSQLNEDSSDPESQPQIQENKIKKVSKLEISKIPKLELSKAKQIQELIVQKINNDDNKKKGVVKEQKVKKIENELATIRKKLGGVMLEKIEIEKENSFLKRFIKQLEGRNQVLSQQKRDQGNVNLSFKNDLRNHSDFKQTETLLDICKDLTFNQVLCQVVKGNIQIPYNPLIVAYDI